jgi:two-component system, LytTR family, response regulator
VSTLRALIVDDERLARNELRRLLGAHPEIEIAGEAANAKQARNAILDLEPDLLFLDVQMPEESGFELLASLDSVPLVVFTTAYDQYALDAFEVSALDYLLKPIDPARLARTVERLLAAGVPSAPVLPAKTDATRLSENHRVFVAEGERYWLVRLGEIRLFESVGNSTRVFFGNEKPLISRSLSDLLPRLDERLFFQANRHQIMNLKAIRSIQAWFGGRMMAQLEGGHEVTLSRRRSRVFRERMSV